MLYRVKLHPLPHGENNQSLIVQITHSQSSIQPTGHPNILSLPPLPPPPGLAKGVDGVKVRPRTALHKSRSAACREGGGVLGGFRVPLPPTKPLPGTPDRGAVAEEKLAYTSLKIPPPPRGFSLSLPLFPTLSISVGLPFSLYTSLAHCRECQTSALALFFMLQ
jgi:hypothetical protein